MGMYEMHREDLIRTMVSQAVSLRDQVLTRMALDYQKLCKQLGDDYQSIAAQALTVPANTAELMNFITFVQKVENEIVFVLEDRLRLVCKYMLFLSDYTTFSPAEMKQNSATFQWYSRMASVFEEHRQIVRIKKFEEDLEHYKKQLEEFKSYGDIEELPRYLKKALHLDNRIQQALEKIDQFNSEEVAYKWEQSQYPLRKQLYPEGVCCVNLDEPAFRNLSYTVCQKLDRPEDMSGHVTLYDML
uniref:Uncharacterized protein n=1 Tax=Timema poppense TaxID=170557 RepID=A0A7R9DL45_TIMPO|nr:unnamed protein product [Timema poppensis]